MKRLCIGLGFFLLLAGFAQGQLPKQRLFKVDPLSGLFKEIRVVAEYRIKGPFWAYVAPLGFHQNYIPRSNNNGNRPPNPQKYYGIGTRLGMKYFLTENSPKGLFIQPMAIYKYNRVNHLSSGLEIVEKEQFHSLGVGFTVGWQNLFGPKENFAYGVIGGMEYYRQFGRMFEADEYVENWYQLPFAWKPEFLNGFRVYLGIELGFAFRQKHLHW